VDRMAAKRRGSTSRSAAKAGNQQVIRAEKTFVSAEARSPETDPVFVNEVQVTRVGTDAFLDFGLVPSDDILGAAGKKTVRFIVKQRIAMSINTFAVLRRKIEEIYGRIGDVTEILSEDLRDR